MQPWGGPQRPGPRGEGPSAFSRIEQLSQRFAELVATGPPATPVSGSPGWTVRDVVAHMATVVPRYVQGLRGGGAWVDDPADLPALNEQLLRELGPVPVPELVDRIRSDVRSLLAQIRGYGDEVPTFRFNGGESVRSDDALGLLAGEFLVHGRDIADVLDRRWPITVGDVEMALHGVEQVLPGFVDPDRAADHHATYEILLRGGGTYRWRFEGGNLDCQADRDGPVDCRIRGEAAALMLVMYGRVPAWRVALTGRVFAWGRRPWLALSLAARFHNP